MKSFSLFLSLNQGLQQGSRGFSVRMWFPRKESCDSRIGHVGPQTVDVVG